jgi:hypothetical protein
MAMQLPFTFTRTANASMPTMAACTLFYLQLTELPFSCSRAPQRRILLQLAANAASSSVCSSLRLSLALPHSLEAV